MKNFIIGACLCLFSLSTFAAVLDAGDINHDKHVNLRDFACLAEDWRTSEARSDIVLDGTVDVLDLMQLAEDWLKSTNPDNPEVTLQITGAVNGLIVIELYADEAPITVDNFLNYVQSGFYDGLIFHCVIPDFMIQGGGFDPNMVQKQTNPAIINESSNRLSNLRGTIAMARTSYPDTATSQFFINQNVQDNFYLDYGYIGYDYNYNPPKSLPAQVGYCVFGEVLSGMDIVDAIAALPTTNNQPDDDVIILSATITQNVAFCPEKMQGDIDGNCKVDFTDFVMLAENWMLCNSTTVPCN